MPSWYSLLVFTPGSHACLSGGWSTSLGAAWGLTRQRPMWGGSGQLALDAGDGQGLRGCSADQEGAAGNQGSQPGRQGVPLLHGQRHQAADDCHAGSCQQGHCPEGPLQGMLCLHRRCSAAAAGASRCGTKGAVHCRTLAMLVVSLTGRRFPRRQLDPCALGS